jgi:hypothetical protein
MPCSSVYCISGAGIYDGNYGIGPTQINGYDYFTGDTSPTYYIYYNSGSTNPSWCLSTLINGPCLLFGKSPCLTSCPDLCDTFFGVGPCPTPTPTPTAFCNIDFDAIFDCGITPTPSPTPTVTPTTTPTPTPTPTNPCGGISLVVTAVTITATPSPTPSVTPTQTPEITRPCNFTGKVTFNTIDDFLRCAVSKKFRDCISGFLFYSSDIILTEFGTLPSLGTVYRAVINDSSVCVVYDGQVENISGADDISLIETIGPESNGSCLNCFPIASQTPTPTPTNTPTPTPTKPLITCKKFNITNNDYFSSRNYTYKNCEEITVTISVGSGVTEVICCSSAPQAQYFSVTQDGFC